MRLTKLENVVIGVVRLAHGCRPPRPSFGRILPIDGRTVYAEPPLGPAVGTAGTPKGSSVGQSATTVNELRPLSQ